MPICHQLFSTLEVSNTVYHSSDCLLHDLVDLNGGKRVPKASAGWAALGIMSLLLGNIIYVLLFDLWTVPGQEAPSPQSVFALVTSECPGLVHGGSLHWETQAPGYRTGESQVDQCQSSACSQQVRRPKGLTLPVQTAQCAASPGGVWRSVLRCARHAPAAPSADSRCRSRPSEGEHKTWKKQPDVWRARGENVSAR